MLRQSTVKCLTPRKVRGTYTVEKSHRWRYHLHTCGKIESTRFCAIYWKNKTIRTQATAATQRACSLSYQRGYERRSLDDKTNQHDCDKKKRRGAPAYNCSSSNFVWHSTLMQREKNAFRKFSSKGKGRGRLLLSGSIVLE